MADDKIGVGELLAAFFDNGVCTPLFEESEATLAAFGTVSGQNTYVVCQKGQPVSAMDLKLCCRVMELAGKTGNPVLTVYDSPGVVIKQGADSLAAAKKLAECTAKFSGVVPQIAVVRGVCASTAAMAAANADVCIMTEDAQMFLTAPFISAAQGEADKQAGSVTAAVSAGVVGITAKDGADAMAKAAKLLALLPQNNLAQTASFEFGAPQAAFDLANYTGENALAALVDTGSALELFGGFGEGVLTCLATIGGNVAGIVATDGKDSYLQEQSTAKVARFARLCDAYSIPLVTVLNSGGFLQSSKSDVAGTLRNAARLAATYADATTARVCVLAGQTFGALYAALGTADLTIAVQGSVTAPVKPSAAVSVLYKEEIESGESPIEAQTAALAKQYEEEQASAAAMLQSGVADMTAQPAQLREKVLAALGILETKRAQRMPKKHGNMPL